jgi:hypothetical protein
VRSAPSYQPKITEKLLEFCKDFQISKMLAGFRNLGQNEQFLKIFPKIFLTSRAKKINKIIFLTFVKELGGSVF